MRKYFIFIFLIALFEFQLSAQEQTDINPEELEALNITLFNKQENLPLEGIVTLDGETFDLSALKGKYALVNLGASWCQQVI